MSAALQVCSVPGGTISISKLICCGCLWSVTPTAHELSTAYDLQGVCMSAALHIPALQVRSVPGGTISISKLGPDYLSSQGVCSTLQLQHHQQQQQQTDIGASGTESAAPAAAAGLTGVASMVDDRGTTAGAAAAAAAAAGEEAAAGVAAKFGGAAPCLFAYDGRWYLLVSKGAGW
jgi:hypothetical protein